MKLLLFIGLLIPVAAVQAQAKNVRGSYFFTLTGENYLEINGEGSLHKRVEFKSGYGDWYVKPGDACASIRLRLGEVGNQYELDLGWDGAEKEQQIVHTGTFQNNRFFHFAEPGPQAFYCDVSEDDKSTSIHVIQMDETTLIADIDGMASANLRQAGNWGMRPVHVHGKISLKKEINARILTSKFGDCVPMVYNKTPGAEDRTPSDCEIKFDQYLGDQFDKAISEPLKNYFETLGYSKSTHEEHALVSVPFSFHERFFDNYFAAHSNVTLTLVNKSLPNLSIGTRVNEISDSLVLEEKKRTGEEPDMSVILDKTMKIYQDQKEASARAIHVYWWINTAEKFVFGGSISKNNLDIGGYLLVAGKRKSETHGRGDSFHHEIFPNEALACIGHWDQPVVRPYDETTMELVLTPRFHESAPHLSVQTMVIIIQCVPELREKVLELIDWKTLNAMVER
ncbi:MAG: hypothetical protein ACJ75B_22315 [Flavisolibacter sp.]